MPDASSDPLAELARLIGQSDAHGGESSRHDRYGEVEPPDAASAGLDWAAEQDDAEPRDYGDERYAAPPPLAASQGRTGEDEARTEPRFASGAGAPFNGFREDAEDEASGGYVHSRGQPEAPAPLPPRRVPAYAFGPSATSAAAEAQHHEDGQDYAADEEYDDQDEAPPRRRGLVLVMAVLGLAVLGTAGAFGYRSMFGGSAWPALPPIIKASVTPNKIVPNADAPANPGQPAPGSAEHLAPPAEQPVDLQQTAPRVVATIPVSAPPPPPASAAGAPPPAAALPSQAATAPPSPPLPPAAVTPFPPPPPAPIAAAPASPAPAQPAAEPKKVHTVSIHANQPAGNAAVAAPATHRPSNPPPPRGNAPLSIIPGAEGDAPAPVPARSHAAAEPMRVATAAPENSGEAAGGASGYAVQVSSQRTEAEAKASFHALRAKFPKELGGREPIVRRADLGPKGIYYRALVGPFASMEEAASLCSSLKAAGGNCLIQRN